MFVLISRC